MNRRERNTTLANKCFLMPSAAACLLLAACTGPGGVQPKATANAAPKPVPLVKKAAPRNEIEPLNAPSVLRTKNEPAIAKAVNNYRINKKKKSTENRSVAADLNGDGSVEVLALMSGKDWCTPAGCDLILFRETDRGLRPMQQIRRVKAPIVVSPIGQQGWRDIIVQTGGKADTLGQKVRLRFAGSGYPKNAMTQPKVRVGIPSTGETVLPRFGAAPNPSAPAQSGVFDPPPLTSTPRAALPQESVPDAVVAREGADSQRPSLAAGQQTAVLPTRIEPDPFRGPGPDTEPR